MSRQRVRRAGDDGRACRRRLRPPRAFVSPHLSYSLTTDACAACHATHQAQNENLLREREPQSSLCFRCHDGTGAVTRHRSREFTSPSVPPNDPSAGAVVLPPGDDRHRAHLGARSRVRGQAQPPRRLRRLPPAAPVRRIRAPFARPAGWTASGCDRGRVRGLGRSTARPGRPRPTRSRRPPRSSTSCASSATPAIRNCSRRTRRTRAAGRSTRASSSTRPTPPTTRSRRRRRTRPERWPCSLSGTSPSKLWTFDSVIHDPLRELPRRTLTSRTRRTRPAAKATLDNHAGPNRGILIAPYRDRQLLGQASRSYDATDFSLCYVCHAEAPMVDGTGDVRTDTNFNWHGLHLQRHLAQRHRQPGHRHGGRGPGQRRSARSATSGPTARRSPSAARRQPRASSKLAPDVQPLNGTLRFDAWRAGIDRVVHPHLPRAGAQRLPVRGRALIQAART